jgi:hypothetical protein
MSRTTLIGPVVFTLIGAGTGVCLAMLFHQDPSERAHVYIGDSLPFAIGGIVLGTLVGCGVSAACTRWPRLLWPLGVVSVTLLGAAMTAPIGWILGDSGAERFPREGMTIGAAVGAALGLVLGAVQMLLDWRGGNA